MEASLRSREMCGEEGAAEGLSAAPTSLPFCTVQWETEDSRVKECSGPCEATGGKSLVLICLYFLLPKSILSGNKLN